MKSFRKRKLTKKIRVDGGLLDRHSSDFLHTSAHYYYSSGYSALFKFYRIPLSHPAPQITYPGCTFVCKDGFSLVHL